MRPFSFMLSGICMFLSVACTHRNPEARELQTVKTDTVAAAGTQTVLQFPGKVKAAQDINMAFRVSGTILKMHAENGAFVRKGDVLAELDPTDYQVQLDATEAEYKQIKAEAERVIALYKENGTTPNTYDKAVYGLKQITAKYQHHKDQLAYTRLYAPFDGYVQKQLFHEHETIGAGMPVLSIISSGIPEVEINLPATEYIRREQFTGYHCTFDIYPGRTYPMKCISITPKANANQLYTMRLLLMPDGQPLPSPGMNTMVTIRCEDEADRTLSVPQGAIREADGQACVFVYNPDSRTVHSCRVSVVRLLGNGRSIVTSNELQPGQQVVSSGVHHIKDG